MTSAFENISKITSKYISAILIITISGGLLSALFLLLAHQKIKDFASINQEIDAITKSNADTQEVRTYVQSNQSQLSSISQFFPNQNTIIDALDQLESLFRQFDSQSSVAIIDRQPVQTSTGPAIHFNARLEGSYVTLQDIFRQLEKLPLIVQVISFDISNPRQETGEIQINLRVYVDQPFNQSP